MFVTPYEQLPLDSQRRLEAVCTAFERAWSDGGRPDLTDSLADAPPRERIAWLTELLHLELECRRRAGESPDAAEYHERLPNDIAVINSVFAEIAASAVGVGSVVGKYRLTRLIGRGGMSSVYEAEDPVIGRLVAVKLLTGRADAARVTEEARLAGRLIHANIVTIYEAGCDNGVWYMAMERMTASAAEKVKQNGPLDPLPATRIVADICRGLAAAHTAGLVHRDIKPANVLLVGGETPGTLIAKLSDFGLAHEIRDGGISTSAGTPSYMPPEEFVGRPVGPVGDIYSLGATYYTLLTGQPPYQVQTTAELMAAHRDAPIPDPRAVHPKVPATMARIVARAMAKNPAHRYPSTGAMLADLEAVLAGSPRRPRPVRIRPALIVAGLFALVTLATLVVVLRPMRGSVRSAQREEPETGWIDLFNGRDLEGWQPFLKGGKPGQDATHVFSVVNKDGEPMIRVSGTHQGTLTTAGEYENYHLRLEYRWETPDGPHKSALLYHAVRPPRRAPAGVMNAHGLNITPLQTGSYMPTANHHGGTVAEWHNGWLESINPDRPRQWEWQNREHPLGQWNQVELVCVSDTALHAVNGSVVLALAQSRPTRGRIQLLSSQGTIYFRHIQIRPVTKTPARFQRMIANPGG